MRVPNILTLTRMCIAPLFILLFTQETGWGRFGALLLGILIEVTDILDGVIARRTGQVSDLGKFLDPLADSLSRFTVFLCFMARGYASIWIVALIFWRDGIVSSLRILGATRDVIISARWSGKLKAVVQGTAIITTLCFVVWPGLMVLPDALGLGFEDVVDVARALMYVVGAVTLFSLFDYLHGNRRILASLRT